MSTRADLRKAVGRNLRDALAGFSPTVVDADTISIPPYYVTRRTGGFIAYYQNQQVSVGDVASGADGNHTVQPSFVDGFVAGESAELWGGDWYPEQINDFINQAVIDAEGYIFTNIDPLYFCYSWYNRRLELPPNVAMVTDVFYRGTITYSRIYSYEQWEAVTDDDDVNVRRDDYDFRSSFSRRFDIGAGAPSDVVYMASFASTNISSVTHFEGWFKTRNGANLSALTLVLRSGSVTLETVDLRDTELYDGDVAADEWTYLRIPVQDPTILTHVDNVQLTATHSGAAIIWLDGLWGVDVDSIEWTPLNRDYWYIEQETRTLAITHHRSLYNYPVENVMLIRGGGTPPQLDSDTDDSDIPDNYLINRATELALASRSGGRETDPQSYFRQAEAWRVKAEVAKAEFPRPFNVRPVQ